MSLTGLNLATFTRGKGETNSVFAGTSFYQKKDVFKVLFWEWLQRRWFEEFVQVQWRVEKKIKILKFKNVTRNEKIGL